MSPFFNSLVTIETFFEKPPLTLIPGETVELIYGFTHSGIAEDGGTRVQFWYDSEGVDMQPNTVFAYAPWADNFDGTANGSYSFQVPSANSGGEIEIYASWWNAEPCLVIWKYQAQEASETTDEVANPVQKEEPSIDLDPGNVQTSPITLAGHAIALVGDVNIIGSGQKKKLFRLDPIWLGTCIRTGERGRVRIRMNDVTIDGEWVDQNIPGNSKRIDEVLMEQGNVNPALSRVRGPSYINIGSNSELCFDAMMTDFREETRFSGLVGLIEGQIRVFLKGWSVNSSFDVRAGVAICGIRGSEVLIAYIPEYIDSDLDVVTAKVLTGHMDVTSGTGETVSLYNNQQVIIYGEEMTDVRSLDQEEWNSNLEFFGVSEAGFPEVDIEEWEIIAEDMPEDLNSEDEITLAQETRPPLAGYIFILCGVLICGAAIVTMLTIVYFVRKRSEQ